MELTIASWSPSGEKESLDISSSQPNIETNNRMYIYYGNAGKARKLMKDQ